MRGEIASRSGVIFHFLYLEISVSGRGQSDASRPLNVPYFEICAACACEAVLQRYSQRAQPVRESKSAGCRFVLFPIAVFKLI